ncbi:MAG TPA: transposase [Lacunisphaera sp.]|nr:transposase [Lacunisphaera sp.]
MTPAWVRGSPVFFITQCAAQRSKNTFCHDDIAKLIFAAAANYHERNRWHVHLMLLMRDHLHALMSFPQVESMSQVLRTWKHYLSRQHHLEWQRDYFDHRIRDPAGLQDKAAYIRQNPVRAGLAIDPGEWRFVWSPAS